MKTEEIHLESNPSYDSLNVSASRQGVFGSDSPKQVQSFPQKIEKSLSLQTPSMEKSVSDFFAKSQAYEADPRKLREKMLEKWAEFNLPKELRQIPD